MPNSLKSRIKKLAYQDIISEKDRDRIISALDIAEQEQKTAQWEMIGTIGLAFKCSRCRENSIIKSNYCPSCGAKMESGEMK